MAVDTLTSGRTLRKSRRLDWRAVVGPVLALMATGGLLLFWNSSGNTQPVLVARRDLPAGATLDATSVTTARVQLTDTLYAVALSASQAQNVIGKKLAEPVHAGQVLVRPQIATRDLLGPGQRAMSVRLDKDSSTGGQLRPGDRVEILLTTNAGEPDAATSVVVSGITVYDVMYEDAGRSIAREGDDEGGDPSALTLIVTPEQALALTSAKHNGQLDVLLLPKTER